MHRYIAVINVDGPRKIRKIHRVFVQNAEILLTNLIFSNQEGRKQMRRLVFGFSLNGKDLFFCIFVNQMHFNILLLNEFCYFFLLYSKKALPGVS